MLICQLLEKCHRKSILGHTAIFSYQIKELIPRNNSFCTLEHFLLLQSILFMRLSDFFIDTADISSMNDLCCNITEKPMLIGQHINSMTSKTRFPGVPLWDSLSIIRCCTVIYRSRFLTKIQTQNNLSDVRGNLFAQERWSTTHDDFFSG